MKVLLAEYAVSIGMGGTFLLEGEAMLKTLAESFTRLGHDVIYTSNGTVLKYGTPVQSNEDNFEAVLEVEAKKCDAGLVIAPDELLFDLATIIEENTINLGCSPESSALCADKVKSTEKLLSAGIPAPRIVDKPDGGRYVVKPISGCASEDTRLCSDFVQEEGFIATEYIVGEHLSVSLVCGDHVLPLAVNKQKIDFNPEKEESPIEYNGCLTPYRTPYQQELYETAIAVAKTLGCHGYIGVDIVLGTRPYVVDVNPRPTTSMFGICKVMKEEIGELLLKSCFGGLPESVEINGMCMFTKEDLQ